MICFAVAQNVLYLIKTHYKSTISLILALSKPTNEEFESGKVFRGVAGREAGVSYRDVLVRPLKALPFPNSGWARDVMTV